MRYIKKIAGGVIEYAGPALGGNRWYVERGFTPYGGSLPASRLDIDDSGEVIELPPPVPVPVLISKLKLKRKLEAAGQWGAFKAALEAAGFTEDFELAVNLSTSDPAFQATLSGLAELIAGAGVTASELLAECVWEG